jgi:glutamate N-acetyltransferase / amino-acid N-acetyltransferase
MSGVSGVSRQARSSLAPLEVDLPPVGEVVRLPAGFRAGAVAAGIKASRGLDLGILATTNGPASVAGTFTTSRLPAAPVRLSRTHLEATAGRTTAILSTSGCANAATGEAGERDQAELADLLAASLGIRREQTLAVSTGLIGSRLPVDRLREPLTRLATDGLAATDAAFGALAGQLMTTDTRPKAATVRLELRGPDGRARGVTVAGIAKGVGMIHPNMATMLAFVLTDATAEPETLGTVLSRAVERTWNQLTVDGDMSTNDTVFLLASGASGAVPVEADDAAVYRLARSVEAVARSLARQQAADGEGATTLLTCGVSGARDEAEARAVARAVVGSSLVKAAAHGRDPNWGRILAAVGTATVDGRPVPIDERRLVVGMCGVTVFAGEPVPFDRDALARRMASPELEVRVDLGAGAGMGEAWGCDLTEAYVAENSAYST